MKRTAPFLLSPECCLFAEYTAFPQTAAAAKAAKGSETAKNGFRNETDIQLKFNDWRNDADAQGWLRTLGCNVASVKDVSATKPHGDKADVEVIVTTSKGTKKYGISIKLVSSPNGFNQIDKRWLSHYVKMWSIPANVEEALKLFLGETPPVKPSRDPKRMYLDELDENQRNSILEFFSKNKTAIVDDLFRGDGDHAADWVMVASKATENTRWTLRSTDDVIRFYSEGPVALTARGNLKIGRITMQRKGGDGGRESAKMLQFKINPALLLP